MSTGKTDIHLTDAQQRYLLSRAERLGKTAEEILQGLVPSADEEGNLQTRSVGNGETALEAARAFGLVGASTDDPPDLATNPKYMEGFGRDNDLSGDSC